MSRSDSMREMSRFLQSDAPEVLSVSGRWGVGKTHAWNEALTKAGDGVKLRRYAYVSAFRLHYVEALKSSSFQSTVILRRSLD